MKNILLLLLPLTCFVNTSAQTDSRLKNIDKDLDAILEATYAAGFAVAVVEKDKIIYAKGFGYSDVENKVPVDANTLFAIGSSTKAFTSSVLGVLRSKDKLSFDDSPIKYVPELKFYNDDMNNQINIKDLMSHRTGLPRHDYSWYLFPTFDQDSLISRIQYQEPFTGIREQWYYNNFMFLAQGVIGERITGDSWMSNVRNLFFKPLGMNRSNLSIAELEKSTNKAFGYETEKDNSNSKMDYYKIAAMRPAGSINSSVNEMSNWLITWINKGKFKDQEIIPEAYVNEAMSSHMIIDAALPDKEIPDVHFSNYGYAWFLASYKGHYRVEHGGNIDGFSANVAFFPSDSIGVVVLANQNGSRVPTLVRNTIADRMLGVSKTNWTKRFLEAQEKAKKAEAEVKTEANSGRVANTKPSHIKQDYTGSYNHPGYGDFEVKVERDSLFAEFKLMTMWLKHYHYDIFEPFEVEETGIDTTETGPLRINFTTNNSGNISGVNMQIEPALKDAISFKRTPNTIEISNETLEKYVGKYELQPGFILDITIKDGKIFAQATGQGKNQIFAKKEHHFFLKVVEAELIFSKGEDGQINMLTLLQGGSQIPAKKIE